MTPPISLPPGDLYDRNFYPETYRFQTTLHGLVPSQWWCGPMLAYMRASAETLTHGRYGLFVARSPVNGERIGYTVGADQDAVVQSLLATYEQARMRAERSRP